MNSISNSRTTPFPSARLTGVSMDRATTTEATGMLAHLGLSTWYAWLALLSITIGFWLIDNSWDRSLLVMESELYTGSDNYTADRLESINPNSSMARLVLAAIGILGLVLPNATRFRFSSPLFWTIVAFFGWLCLSLLWSIHSSYTVYKLAVLVVLGCASVGISRQLTLREIALLSMYACTTFIFVGVIAEIALGTFSPLGEYRFTGTSHPNTEAIYGSILCLFAPLISSNQFRWKFLALLIFALGLACLMLTKSRTSLAAAVLGVMAIQVLSSRGEKRLLLALGSFLAIGLGAAVLAFMGIRAASQFGSLADMGRGQDMTTLTGRLPLWEILIESIGKSPWIGHGYLAYWDEEQVEYLSRTLKWEIPHGHNMYLDIALDSGLIGLALFFLCLSTSLLSSYGAAWQNESRHRVFLFGLIVCAIVNGLAESLFKLPGFPFFVVFTLLLRCMWEKIPKDSTSVPKFPWSIDRELVPYRYPR